MVLDAQALNNLDIFEVQDKHGKTTEGSLFEHLNLTITKFGARLLRRWVSSPLLDEQKLRDRHEAVGELIDNEEFRVRWRTKIKGTLDLESYLARLYKYSVESQNRAIYINLNVVNRLTEFFE